MRFMILVKATKDSEAGVMPEEKLIAAMAAYHEELAKAGALLDASGLQPSSKGWHIKYSAGKRIVIDGPFAETKELIAGYTIIQVKSKEEALEWTKRFPNPAMRDGEIEVRQLFELEDFGPSEAIERFREMGVGGRSSHGLPDSLAYDGVLRKSGHYIVSDALQLRARHRSARQYIQLPPPDTPGSAEDREEPPGRSNSPFLAMCGLILWAKLFHEGKTSISLSGFTAVF